MVIILERADSEGVVIIDTAVPRQGAEGVFAGHSLIAAPAHVAPERTQILHPSNLLQNHREVLTALDFVTYPR